MRMMVTRKVFRVWVWDSLLEVQTDKKKKKKEVQTEKPTLPCSSLSLLTLILGLKRLKFLLMAIKRISG